MYGIFNITKFQGNQSLGIIATSKEDLKSLNAKNFRFFNRNYTVPKDMEIIDILEIDDEFVEFVTNIDVFVAVNENAARPLLSVIDSCVYLDETNSKTILQIAKEYKIKVKDEDKNNNEQLTKALLMAFKKKEYDKVQPLMINHIDSSLENTPEITVEEIEDDEVALNQNKKETNEIQDNITESIRSVAYINNSEYTVDFSLLQQNKDATINLSKETNKFIETVYNSHINKVDIDFVESITNCCGNNISAFSNLLREIDNIELFDKKDIQYFKNIFIGQKENKVYQDFLGKSIEQGVKLSILKEQLEILMLLKS